MTVLRSNRVAYVLVHASLFCGIKAFFVLSATVL